MKKTYRYIKTKLIKGVSLPVFIHHIDYNLTDIHVYEDGKIDCWGLLDFREFAERVRAGWIKTQIPDGEDVKAHPLGKFVIHNFQTERSEEDLIKEVEDILKKFRNKATSSEICLKKFNSFLRRQTDKRKKELITAYESVPTHHRRYILNDVDVDDIPIRAVIFGDVAFTESVKAENQEDWIREHYLAGIEIERTNS